MWQRLSGRDHFVMTGVAVAQNQTVLHRRLTTEVHFARLSLADMQAYWQPESRLGKQEAMPFRDWALRSFQKSMVAIAMW